ncbi:hypothetical protein NXF25_019960 [Crotalus adamanteus]|uniref:Uncharacterized protein n=1 Tax=Crotalus adamanteus TaxID=8729 RepID=A0AAW1B3H4_CROAD
MCEYYFHKSGRGNSGMVGVPL